MDNSTSRTSSHWSKIPEIDSRIGIQIFLIIHRCLGRWGFRIALIPVIVYFYIFNSTARSASSDYLRRIKPYIDHRHKVSTIKHFFYFSEAMLDKFLIWFNKFPLSQVEIVSKQEVFEIDQGKQGGLIVVSHLGNAEICRALGYQRPNFKMIIVVYNQHASKFNSFFETVHTKENVKLLSVTDFNPKIAMLLKERIELGEYIVIAGDRPPISSNNRTSTVTFFGNKALFPQGSFILAGLLGSPIYLMFCIKQNKKYKIYFELFSKKMDFSRKNRNETINRLVQGYASKLEYYCIQEPLQWYNFFHFWKQ